MFVRTEKLEPLYMAGACININININIKLCSHFGNRLSSCPKSKTALFIRATKWSIQMLPTDKD